jgi:hypothetical protein
VKKSQSRELIAELENMKAESAVYFNGLEASAFREITTGKVITCALVLQSENILFSNANTA